MTSSSSPGDARNGELELALPPNLVASLFPFHAVFDRELILRQIGPSLAKLLPELRPGGCLRDTWRLERPLMPFTFEEILNHPRSLFLIRVSPAVSLRGQMVAHAEGLIAFLCSPWLPGGGELARSGLTFDDFPLHDSMPEFVQVVQTHKLGMEDLRKLTARLRQQREALREANRRLAEQSAEREKLALIAAHTDNGIVITDPSGAIEWANDAFTRITGFTLEEARGKKPGEFLQGPGSDPATVAFIREQLRRRSEFKCEIVNYHKSGRPYWVSIEAQPMRGEDGKVTGFMAIQRDVTGHKEDEAKLELAMRSLELAAKMAEAADKAKTDFLASVSHEIRTPLNSMVGLTEMLLGTTLERDQREMVETIWTGSEILLHLINDLLDFSKIEAGQVEIARREFDPVEVCERAVDIVKSRAHQKKLELIFTVRPEVPMTVGDSARIAQILVNLLTNAVKFTETGAVELELDWREVRTGLAELKFSVTDTGIGVEPEMREKIFERFFRIDTPAGRRAGGTGLGLSIGRSLAEAMGGTLEALPRPDGLPGSRFVLTLRLHAHGGLAPVAAPPGPVRAALLARPGDRELLLRAWRSAGCEVFALDREKPDQSFDVLIREDGLEPDFAAPRSIRVVPPGEDPAAQTPQPGQVITRFPLTPRSMATALREAIEGPDRIPADSGGKGPPAKQGTPARVLLVEDYADSALYAKRVLERAGHHVEIAANAAEAALLGLTGGFDLIFMDLLLPDGSGLDVARRIRLRESETGQARTPIVALTAHALLDYRAEAEHAGIDGYLTKPIRPDALVTAVSERARSSAPGKPPPEMDTATDISDLVPGFLARAREKAERAGQLASAGELQEAARLGHNLKGSGSTYGHERITELGRAMEAAARAGDAAATARHAQSVIDYLAGLPKR